MRSYLWPLTFVLLLICGSAAFAGDVVFMPTGNQVAKGDFEYNFIFVDLDTPQGAPDYAMIHEFFFGLTERLEVDVNVLDLEGNEEDVEINPYFTFVKETDDHPSFIAGAYNIFRARIHTSAKPVMGDSRTSPFFVSSYNIFKPAGPPELSDPLIRGHFGWGTGQHDSDFFGGVQFLVDPKIGGAVYNYQGDMAFIGVYRPRKCLELRAGTLGGDEWGSFGIFATW